MNVLLKGKGVCNNGKSPWGLLNIPSLLIIVADDDPTGFTRCGFLILVEVDDDSLILLLCWFDKLLSSTVCDEDVREFELELEALLILSTPLRRHSM